jgi:hypothetical protein
MTEADLSLQIVLQCGKPEEAAALVVMMDKLLMSVADTRAPRDRGPQPRLRGVPASRGGGGPGSPRRGWRCCRTPLGSGCRLSWPLRRTFSARPVALSRPVASGAGWPA